MKKIGWKINPEGEKAKRGRVKEQEREDEEEGGKGMMEGKEVNGKKGGKMWKSKG